MSKFTEQESKIVLQLMKDKADEKSKIFSEKKKEFEEFKKEHERLINNKELELFKHKAEMQQALKILSKMENAINDGTKVLPEKRVTVSETAKKIGSERKNSTPKSKLPKFVEDKNFITIEHTSKNGRIYFKSICKQILNYVRDNYMDNKWHTPKDIRKRIQTAGLFKQYNDNSLAVQISETLKYFEHRGLLERESGSHRFKLSRLRISTDGLDEALKREREVDMELKK